MNIPIFKLLNADTTVTNILGKNEALRVYRDRAPEEPTYPYVVWHSIGGEPINHIDEPALDDDIQIQVDVYAKSEDERDQTYRAVKNVIKHHALITGYPPIGGSPTTTGSWRESFKCDWLVQSD